MQKLHLVGFTTEHDGLIFSTRRGARSGGYVVSLDDGIFTAVDEAREHREQEAADAADEAITRSDRPESQLTVKEMQARLRTGRTVEEVAAEAGVTPEWVERFAPPVRAEQAQVIADVRASTFDRPRIGPSRDPLGTAVLRNLAERGVALTDEEFDDAWSTYQLFEARWIIEFRFEQRNRTYVAAWEFDTESGELTAADRLSTQLGYVGPGTNGKRPPRRGTVLTTRPRPATSTAAKTPRPVDAAAKKIAAARKAAARKRAETARRAEAARKAEERRRAAEVRKAEQVRKAEERRAAETLKRAAAAAEAAEARRKADDLRRSEEARQRVDDELRRARERAAAAKRAAAKRPASRKKATPAKKTAKRSAPRKAATTTRSAKRPMSKKAAPRTRAATAKTSTKRGSARTTAKRRTPPKKSARRTAPTGTHRAIATTPPAVTATRRTPLRAAMPAATQAQAPAAVSAPAPFPAAEPERDRVLDLLLPERSNPQPSFRTDLVRPAAAGPTPNGGSGASPAPVLGSVAPRRRRRPLRAV